MRFTVEQGIVETEPAALTITGCPLLAQNAFALPSARSPFAVAPIVVNLLSIVREPCGINLRAQVGCPARAERGRLSPGRMVTAAQILLLCPLPLGMRDRPYVPRIEGCSTMGQPSLPRVR